ncbi:acyltransferase family protein [Candidatus Saccharibacteria bacterium]|nr:acyltransferase family protein [Candidatus Saccharibacteria bacterium]
MRSSKRLHYVDIARGVAMFIIVLSHTIPATTPESYAIYRFLFFINVPIFFVLSGFLFHVKENESFFQFLKTKSLRIMLPYFVWALVFLIPYLIFGNEIISLLEQKDIWQRIGNVLYGNGVGDTLQQNGPLWFLPALFTTEIIFYFVVYFVKSKKMEVVAFILTLLVGFLSTFFANKFYLPWGLNSALTIGSFFYFGYLLRKWEVLDRMKPKFSVCLFFICLILCGVAVYFNEIDNVVWADYEYRNYFLTILSGMTSALAIIQISKWIGKNKVIEYVGVNTMSILIFHKVIVVIVRTKLGAFSGLLTDSDIALKLVLSLFVSVIVVAICVVIGILIRRFWPWLIGEQKKPVRLKK